jgi:hypothetical protein
MDFRENLVLLDGANFRGPPHQMSFVKSEPAVEPLTVAPRVAGEILNLGKTAIFTLLKSGALQSVKIGRSRRISLESIRQVAANGAPPPKAPRLRRQTSVASPSARTTPALAAADGLSGK